VQSNLNYKNLELFSNKVASLLEKNDSFIFIDRLIDYPGLFIAKQLSKKNKKVSYWENCNVTDSYQPLKFYNQSIIKFIKQIIISYQFKIFFKYFISHDNEYLGVSKKKITSWGANIVELREGDVNYIFDYTGKWKAFKKPISKEKIVVFALGHSIVDETGFYNSAERKNILDYLINQIDGLKIKYAPASLFNDEYPSNIQLNKKFLLEELSPNLKLVISDYSTSLVACSRLGIKAVSIIDMVNITDQKRYRFWKMYLLNGNKKNPVLFPRNLDELTKLCNLK